MSMFSSFDALFAESFGQKVGFCWPVVSTKESQTSSSFLDNSADKFIGKKMSENQQVQQKRSKTTSTRFAPELDGVHCFETIIRY